MQVLAWMRQRDLSRLGRVLEVMMAPVRADEAPAVRFQLLNNITRIPAHGTPQPGSRIALERGAINRPALLRRRPRLPAKAGHHFAGKPTQILARSGRPVEQ